jgi:uncharacterized protein YdhG (YjbR/CyaY superfamily)
MAKFETIDAYIASFPPDVQAKLNAVRRVIRRAAPQTEETISYGIPTFTLDGKYLVYFAGWKHHISLYPIPTVDDAVDLKLAPYKAAKGTLRFPLDEPIPLDLVEVVAAALLRQRLDDRP